MKYKYNDTIYDTKTEAYEALCEDDYYDEYDQSLDDCYPDFKMFGLFWNASYVLQKIDPIMYSCGYNEFLDYLADDLIEEVDDDEEN